MQGGGGVFLSKLVLEHLLSSKRRGQFITAHQTTTKPNAPKPQRPRVQAALEGYPHLSFCFERKSLSGMEMQKSTCIRAGQISREATVCKLPSGTGGKQTSYLEQFKFPLWHQQLSTRDEHWQLKWKYRPTLDCRLAEVFERMEEKKHCQQTGAGKERN